MSFVVVVVLFCFVAVGVFSVLCVVCVCAHTCICSHAHVCACWYIFERLGKGSRSKRDKNM